jgi:hypothetical protein
MKIICIRPFGHFQPGDALTVPDDALYDSEYFERADDDKKDDE